MDATLISAPSSTKNEKGERDPEMHQTKKGNQWYFGMKGHIGVDSKERIIHSVEVTSANVHDSRMVSDLLHGEETKVWGDSAYQGQKEAIKAAAPAAKGYDQPESCAGASTLRRRALEESTKSKVRARGEHPFLIIKRIFGFTHVRYRGLAKNKNRFVVACALANLYIKRRILLRCCMREAELRLKSRNNRVQPENRSLSRADIQKIKPKLS